jgi:hypothetical protein
LRRSSSGTRLLATLTFLVSAGAAAQGAPAGDVVFAVTGSSNATAHRHWGRMVDEWRAQMGNAARDAAIPVSYQQGEARPIGKPGVLVAIYIRHFRYVTPGMRGVAAQWAGQAVLNADVEFRDLITGKVLSDKAVRVSSEFGEARFAAATNHQVRDASVELMTEVRNLLANPPKPKAEPAPAQAAVAPPPTATDTPAASGETTEIAFWNSIRDRNEPGELRAYLEKYPNGLFADLARLRLARLETTPLRSR